MAWNCVITLALYLKNNIWNNLAQSSSSSISHKALVSWLINIFCNIALFLTTVLSYSVSNANKVQYNVCKLVIQVRSRNESAKSCMITMNKAVSFPNCMCTPIHPTSNKVYVTFSNHSQTKVRKVSVFTELSLTTWLSSFRLLTSKQNIYQTFYGFKRSVPSDICFKMSCVTFTTPLNHQMQRTVHKRLAEKRKLSSKYSKFKFYSLSGPQASRWFRFRWSDFVPSENYFEIARIGKVFFALRHDHKLRDQMELAITF